MLKCWIKAYFTSFIEIFLVNLKAIIYLNLKQCECVCVGGGGGGGGGVSLNPCPAESEF